VQLNGMMQQQAQNLSQTELQQLVNTMT